MQRSIIFMATLFTFGAAANLAKADIPLLNATCPGRMDVHADDGGPIYINGKEAKLKRFNDNYYEARSGNVTISLTIRPDGSPDVSYTSKGAANGICQIKGVRPVEEQPGRAHRRERQLADRPRGMATGVMPAFCRGEASAEFGRRPTEITTNMVFKSGDGYVVQGNFPDGKRTTFFNCWFDADGNFVSVN